MLFRKICVAYEVEKNSPDGSQWFFCCYFEKNAEATPKDKLISSREDACSMDSQTSHVTWDTQKTHTHMGWTFLLRRNPNAPRKDQGPEVAEGIALLGVENRASRKHMNTQAQTWKWRAWPQSMWCSYGRRAPRTWQSGSYKKAQSEEDELWGTPTDDLPQGRAWCEKLLRPPWISK